jgi:hypothetical protein
MLFKNVYSFIQFNFLKSIHIFFKTQVDGHWTDWSSWTSCDVTCGNGTHIRTRTCTNPLPANKGNDCIGESVDSSECLKDNCPGSVSKV